MLDYTKELTLHIQGLGMLFHLAFQEIDETTEVDIPKFCIYQEDRWV